MTLFNILIDRIPYRTSSFDLVHRIASRSCCRFVLWCLRDGIWSMRWNFILN